MKANTTLPLCEKITKTTGKQCQHHVSKLGETFCPTHGGAKKAEGAVVEQTQKYLCGHLTSGSNAHPCEHVVAKDGDLCAQHSGERKTCGKCKRKIADGKEFCKQHDPEFLKLKDQFVDFNLLNVAFIASFAVWQDKSNEIIQDLARWFLNLAEAAQKGPVSDQFLADWYVSGKSNAYGTSFGERHKADPLWTLLNLPTMKNFTEAFQTKFSTLSQNPAFGALQAHWATYGQ